MTGERSTAELVEFVAPGFIHGLGNSLFAMHGQAQVMSGGEAEISRAKDGILKASRKALDGLDILRYLIGEGRAGAKTPAGKLACHLCEFLRVPLRDRGMSLRHQQDPSGVSMAVDGTALCRTMVEVTRQLFLVLPDGFEGSLVVELAPARPNELQLSFTIESSDSMLPFPVDLGAVARNAESTFQAHHARTEECAGATLRVVLGEGSQARPASVAGELGAEQG